mgnify:CR=1 FL=1
MTAPKLPLRPDGGIDFLKLEVLHDPQGDLRYFYNGTWLQEEDFIAATLERVAKWHEEHAAQLENLGDQPAGTGPTVCGAKYWAHRNSAATIRAMKV